jgi:aminoglycoside phosphotransferase (APT) family kinase protein
MTRRRPEGESRPAAPGWIIDLLEPVAVVATSRLGWGLHNETWKVELTDGRRLAVTRLASAQAAASRVSMARLVQPRLVAAGIEVPALVDLEATIGAGVFVTEFVDGTPGAELLAKPAGADVVGSIMGTIWRNLAAVDPSGLPAPANPDPRRIERWLTRSERRTLSTAAGTAVDRLGGREPGFVHGDFVPVNIITRGGVLAALLDFESVRLGDPLVDAAWFDWIVTFHHPVAEPAAWSAFVASASLDDADPITSDLLRTLPLLRLIEILEDAELSDEEVGHWVGMLRACLEWSR